MRDRRPLAVQVREGIREYLTGEGLRPGDRVPSEAEFASRFEVGRTTVREALKALEEQGLIDVHRGRGRFVGASSAVQVDRPVTRFESVTDMMQGLGYIVRNRVLSQRETAADNEAARLLGVEEGTPLLRIERLRLGGGEPLIYSVNLIDRRILPESLDEAAWSGSVVDLLERQGQRIVTSAARISAAPLPPAAREHFTADADACWLLIVETCVTDTGRPVLLAWDYHRSDVFSFRVLRRREE